MSQQTAQQPRPSSQAARPQQQRIKKVRAPWLIGGSLLMVIAVIASIVLYNQVAARTDYLALRADITRGEVLTRDMVGIAALGHDDPVVQLLTTDQFAMVDGRRALADMRAGTIITSDLFADSPPIPDGQALVGAVVGAGEFPITTLGQGDLLALIRLPANRAQDTTDVIEYARVEVFRATALNNSRTRLLLTLQVSIDKAAQVASLIEASELVYVQVTENTPQLVISAEDAADLTPITGGGDDTIEVAPGVTVADVRASTVPLLIGNDVLYVPDAGFVILGADIDALTDRINLIGGAIYIDVDVDLIDDETGRDLPPAFAGPYEQLLANR